MLECRDQKENDRLVTVLTKDYGTIRAFARGAKRMHSPLLSPTSELSYSRIVFFQSKDRYIIDHADTIKIFYDVVNDVVRLSLAMYFSELLKTLVPENVDSAMHLRLVLNALHFMDKKDVFLLKSVFELKTLALSGYLPNLVGCRECGHYESDTGLYHFYLYYNDFLCSECYNKHMPSMTGREKALYSSIDATLLFAMRFIVYSEFNKIFSFNLPEKRARELSLLTENMVKHQLKQTFKTLDFFYSLDP